MNLSDFGLQGGMRKTLVILGAGATRGASFVNDLSGILPPLDRDFFQQLTRMDLPETRRLLEFIRAEYGHEVGISMERFFSEADYTNRFHKELQVDPGSTVKKYQKALKDFYLALPRLMDVATAQECAFHGRLASLMRTQDCIISFNYDCVIDGALRNDAKERWDPGKEGYGVPGAAGAPDWRRHGTKKKRSVSGTVRLLKMHGSLNWRIGKNEIRLVEPSLVESAEDAIIPPTWFKDLTKFPYAAIWKAARKELRSSRIVVVIGYSVPDTDLFARSLLKVEVSSRTKRENLDLVVLVNPDENARKRFLGLIEDALQPSTRILMYDDFRTLDQLLTRSVSRGSATVERSPNEQFMRPFLPDHELAEIIGNQPLPRTEVTKLLWAYIKKHGLQDPEDRRMINADEKLRAVLGGRSRVSLFELTKFVASKLRPIDEPPH